MDLARTAFAGLLALACGAAEPEADPTAAAEEPGAGAYAGRYQVSGYTTVRRSGHKRRIQGTVIIARSAAEAEAPYTATFDLETEFETPDGPIQADVIGSARAAYEEDGLAGTAETRILMASIPGLDPSFPWIPGRLGPRVVSKFRMEPAPEEDGFRIEIETEAAPGESYEPTRTTLRARREAASARQHASKDEG
ncbi:MAG TPA: hypothetical protein VLL75_22465 [Vicinamibacteria bacterium]|nr:hypothetical protein [Vicinamibacteria bacterium]